MAIRKNWFAMKSTGAGKASITIDGEIGMWGVSSKQFKYDLDALGDDVAELEIGINSPGGDVLEGNAIYNYLMEHKAKKTVTVYSLAASMGSVIAMAGGTVRMPSNAFMMIHNPAMYTGGDAEQLRHDAAVLDKIKTNAIKAYRSKASTLSDADIATLMDDETWMTAEDAVAYGFADEVIDFEEPKGEMCFGRLNVPVGVMVAMATKPAPAANTVQKTAEIPAQSVPKQEVSVMVCIKCKHTLADGAKFCTECGSTQDLSMAIERERSEIAMAAKTAERARVAEITALCSAHGLDATKYIADGVAVAVVKDAVLAKITPAAGPVGVSAAAGADESDKRGLVMSASLLLASGKGGAVARKEALEVVKGAGDDSRPSGIHDLIRKVAVAEGMDPRKVMSLDGQSLYRLALQMAERGRASMNSVNPAHLTSVLADVQNKVLGAAYAATPTTYQMVADTVTVKDFKSVKMIQTSGVSKLKQMASGAGFEFTGMKDKQETGALGTFGLAARLSRQILIDDDLGALTDFPTKFGAAAARTVNELFYDTLTSNTHQGPQSSEDSLYMFDSGNHFNVGSTGTPSNTTVAEAERLLSQTRGMKSSDAESAAPIVPYRGRFIIGGTIHNLLAFQLTQSSADPAASGNSGIANFVAANGYVPVLDGYLGTLLTALGHTSAWYLQTEQMMSPLVVLKLQGYETPTIRSAPSQVGEAVGIVFDCLYDFNVAMRDWRGIIWNQGS